MQRINIITGVREEGLTDELTDSIVEFCKCETSINDEVYTNDRLLKTMLISSHKHTVDKMKDVFDTMGAEVTVQHVVDMHDIPGLIIKSMANLVYIDMLEDMFSVGVHTFKELERMSSVYGFDLVYNRSHENVVNS